MTHWYRQQVSQLYNNRKCTPKQPTIESPELQEAFKAKKVRQTKTLWMMPQARISREDVARHPRLVSVKSGVYPRPEGGWVRDAGCGPCGVPST